MENSKLFHSSSLEDLFKKFNSSKNGLTDNEAKNRLKKYGPNRIKEKSNCSICRLFVEQFSSVLVLLLIAAAFFSIFVGEYLDAGAIIVIVILNATLGFFQEYKAEKSLEELQHSEEQRTIVKRDGKEIEILAEQIVPGDILIFSEGNRVTADSRLIQAVSLQVDESMLTGESTSVSKESAVLETDIALADRVNILYSGTVITRGRAEALVLATGMETEIGKLANTIQEMKAEDTPLQKALNRLGKFLAVVSLLAAAPGIGLGLLMGRELTEMILLGISLAVSVVPEGLPVVVTVALALGIKKMLKSKVLVRKLSTAESLGGVNVICTDKTGTITHNQMTLNRALVINKGWFNIGGSGYKISGQISWDKNASKLFGLKLTKVDKDDLKPAIESAILCSDAQLEFGDPTERALLVAGRKLKIDEVSLRQKHERVSELPFSSEEKYMAVLVSEQAAKTDKLIVKGAPEVLISMSDLSEKDRRKYLDINQELASQGLRVLAIAEKEFKSDGKKISHKDLHKLNLISLLAMYDPPRVQVKDALETAKRAGIRVIMLTGDHAQTAQSIAKEVGFKADSVLTGSELDKMSEKEFKEAVESNSIFARVSPHHKLRVLEYLQNKGLQVAMIGDGVNDAVSIKKADVGVAVGSGTDLSKGVADMILLDDNFASIVKGIREARRIFFNIKKFVKFLLSANFDEVLQILSSIVFSLPIPLLPIHILWINLATDSLPALALAVDVADEDLMRRKPYKPKEEILHGVTTFSIFSAIVTYTLAYSFFVYSINILHWSVQHARTLNLNLMVLFEFFLLFSVRTDGVAWSMSIFKNKLLFYSIAVVMSLQVLIVYHPFAQRIFKTTSLALTDWFMLIGIAMIGFLILELYKFVLRRNTTS